MGNEAFGDFSVSMFVSGFQMREGLRETQTLIFPAVNVVVNKSKLWLQCIDTCLPNTVHSVTELFLKGYL